MALEDEVKIQEIVEAVAARVFPADAQMWVRSENFRTVVRVAYELGYDDGDKDGYGAGQYAAEQELRLVR
jgi:hypothetical protein